MSADLRFPRVRAVAFDLDGTLLDTVPDIARAAARMLEALGLPGLPEQELRSFVGRGMAWLVDRSFTTASGSAPSPAELAHAVGLYERLYAAVIGERTRDFPGVREGLSRLRGRGMHMACLTNKMHWFAARHLELAGLASTFALTVGGDSLARRKPDPLPLQHIARQFGVAPHELLMVGDSANDAQAARAAGCPVVLVPYGYSEGVPVQEIDCDGIVDSFVAISEHL